VPFKLHHTKILYPREPLGSDDAFSRIEGPEVVGADTLALWMAMQLGVE
jgi:hypothetical protein